MEQDPRYPVGKFRYQEGSGPRERDAFVQEIGDLPGRVRQAVAGLDDRQQDTPYRDGGWTVRQVVHHLADSHMNSFIRFKLALTEETPRIKPYDQGQWAALPDSRLPIQVSLKLLEGLHARWVALLQALAPQDWARTFEHPENGLQNLDRTLQLYAWHGRHHTAHITTLRAWMGW